MDRFDGDGVALAAPERASRGWPLLLAPPLAAIITVGTLAASGFLAVLVIKPAPSQAEIARFARSFLTSYPGEMALTIFIYGAILLAMWLLLPKRGPASLQSYFRSVPLVTLGAALGSGVVLAFCVGATFQVLSQLHLVTIHPAPGEREIVPHSFPELGMALVAIGLVGPIVEEIYFRGLLLRWLRERMPLVVAAIPNAFLFAAIHFRFATHVGIEGWVVTGALFVVGLFAVAWASGTRSLWSSIMAHGMYNATLISAPLLAGQTN